MKKPSTWARRPSARRWSRPVSGSVGGKDLTGRLLPLVCISSQPSQGWCSMRLTRVVREQQSGVGWKTRIVRVQQSGVGWKIRIVREQQSGVGRETRIGRKTRVVREQQSGVGRNTRIGREKASWSHPIFQRFQARTALLLPYALRVMANGLSCTRHQVLEKPYHEHLLRRWSAIQWKSHVPGAQTECPGMANRGLRPPRFGR